ncbi:MAG: lipopolysaccharide biosynthesis protein RfbH [Pseudomonadota bacterium]
MSDSVAADYSMIGDEREELRAQILALTARYAEIAHAPKPFVAGQSPVPVSGRVYDGRDMTSLVDSALDFWLTTGPFNDRFEARLAKFLGARFVLTCNSGSSANLLAATALTSPLLGDRALKPGDEVITCATGFPTTINPLLQNGLVPVFLDVDIPTYNIRADLIEAAVTSRTRAIMVAHALGNPFDLGTVMEVAKKHDLFVVEDTCDALGATYDGKIVGTFGDIGTVSFYPAHHITMGEGGAVFATRSIIKRALESLRDWGRDCWCAPGHEDTCKKRFAWQLGELPFGYDHKYTYSHLGYNLKITDMQAAVGLAQLDHLESFIASRRANFARLKAGLKPFSEFLILPEATPKSDPSWFGFTITVRESAPFARDDLIKHLNAKKIGTRLLFAGNLVRQPYMKGRPYRIFGELAKSDQVMRDTFWVGVYPGLGDGAIDYMIETIGKFCASGGKT